MPTNEKAVFQVEEPSAAKATFGADKAASGAEKATLGAEELRQKKSRGPERRHENRRGGHDRRLDVRFELSAEDRRKSHGRREGDNAPHFW